MSTTEQLRKELQQLETLRNRLRALAGGNLGTNSDPIELLPGAIRGRLDDLASYPAEHARISSEIEATRAAAVDRLTACEGQLQEWDTAPRPLPGSPAAENLAQQVRSAYARRAADDALRAELQELQTRLALDDADDLVTRARAGAASCLPKFLDDFARHTVARVEEMIRTGRVGDMTNAKDLASVIVSACDRFPLAVAVAEELAGSSLNAPRIAFEDVEAWRAVAAGRTPALVSPESKPADAEQPSRLGRLGRAILGARA